MSTAHPDYLALLALLALVPVVMFALVKSPLAWLSVVSVLVIAGSLYYMFSASETATAGTPA